MKAYRHLKTWSRNNYRTLVVPIMCSEYYILNAFTTYCNSVWSTLTDLKLETKSINKAELEKYYKLIISNLDKCLHTDLYQDDKDIGKYYVGDCSLCGLQYVRMLSYSDKIDIIVKHLPVKISDCSKDSMMVACNAVLELEVKFDRCVDMFLDEMGVSDDRRLSYYIGTRVQVVK